MPKSLIFLLSLLLWGCTELPIQNIAIKVAISYCENNGGVAWVQRGNFWDYGLSKYRFGCKNGLQSDWQEMKEEPTKEILK